jgi:hypothetical protein
LEILTMLYTMLVLEYLLHDVLYSPGHFWLGLRMIWMVFPLSPLVPLSLRPTKRRTGRLFSYIGLVSASLNTCPGHLVVSPWMGCCIR